MSNVTRSSRKRYRSVTRSRSSRSSSQATRRLSFSGSVPGYGSASFSYGSDDSAFSSSGFLPTALSGGVSSKTGGFVSTVLKQSYSSDIYNSRGTSIVLERGGQLDGGISTQTSGNTVAVGHCSMPSLSVFASLWRAIIKQLVLRMGVGDVSNLDLPLPTASITDTIVLDYRINAESSPTTMTHTLDSLSSIENIAQHYWTTFNTLIAEFQNLEILSITYTPGTSKLRYTRMNLVDAKLAIVSKSTLKIQNRSLNSVNDEEAVDNMPLHGKAYYGKGTGAKPVTRDNVYPVAATGFYGDDGYGIMAKVPTEKWYQEPVPAQHFVNVSSFGKILIEPGHIKTSVLSDKVVLKLDTVFRVLLSKNMSAAKHAKTGLGTYRFCILEKIINANTPSSTNSIKIAYENNTRIASYLMTSNLTTSAQANVVGTFVTEA